MQTIQEKKQRLFQKKSIRVLSIHHSSSLHINTLIEVITKDVTAKSLKSVKKNELDKEHIDEMKIADIILLETSIGFSDSHPEISTPPPVLDYMILRYIAETNPYCIVIWLSQKGMSPVEHVDLQLSYDAEDVFGLLQKTFTKP